MATLWALAALAALAAYIDGVVASDLRHALEARQSLEAELARRSTEATLVYLLATGRTNHRALILEKEQRFSDPLPRASSFRSRRRGAAGDGGRLRRSRRDPLLHPGRRRFGLRQRAPFRPSSQPCSRMPGSTASEVEGILARVEDYIDSDHTLSLNGAERYDYRERGDEPPLNWIMASPLELRRVLGVEELIAPAQWRRLRPLLTMRPVYSYNFNTMRPEILAVLLGLDERGMQAVLEEREKGPVYRISRFEMLSGRHLDIDEMELRTLPTRFMRIAVWHESEGTRVLSGIALAPYGDTAPWRKDYRYRETIGTLGASKNAS